MITIQGIEKDLVDINKEYDFHPISRITLHGEYVYIAHHDFEVVFVCRNIKNVKKEYRSYLEAKQNSHVPKPPVGLKPKWLHDEQRLDEIKAAISRYTEKGEPIPQEWIEEYNSLIKTDKRYDRHK